MLLLNGIRFECPTSDFRVTIFQQLLLQPDAGSSWTLAQDCKRRPLTVDTTLVSVDSTTDATSASSIFHSALATATRVMSLEDKAITPETIDRDGGGELLTDIATGCTRNEVMMARSDSGFSDGESHETMIRVASKEPEDNARIERRRAKSRSRKSSQTRQDTKPTSDASVRTSKGVRRGSRPTTSRHASVSEMLPKRLSGSSPASSIRSATSSRRATISNRSYTTPTSVDIEHALAVHQKSCQLFQSLGETVSSAQHNASLAPAPTKSHLPHKPELPQSAPHEDAIVPRPSTSSVPATDHDHNPSMNSHVLTTTSTATTTILWTSHNTRRHEYAKIDRQHSGLRGLVRRWTPNCFRSQSSSRRPFYQERSGSGSDTDSVRRYRLDLPDEEEARDEEKD